MRQTTRKAPNRLTPMPKRRQVSLKRGEGTVFLFHPVAAFFGLCERGRGETVGLTERQMKAEAKAESIQTLEDREEVFQRLAEGNPPPTRPDGRGHYNF